MRNIWLFLILLCMGSACNSDRSQSSVPGTTGNSPPAIKEARQAPETAAAETDREPSGPNHLIVPGKSIGLIKLNEQSEVVKRILGEPNKGDAAMGKMLATWFTAPPASEPDSAAYITNIFFVRDMGSPNPDSEAKQIRITSPAYRLENKTGVNSAIKTVQAYFPNLKRVAAYSAPKTSEQITVYHDLQAGIAFEVNRKEKVVGISIQEPGKTNYQVYSAVAADFKKL